MFRRFLLTAPSIIVGLLVVVGLASPLLPNHQPSSFENDLPAPARPVLGDLPTTVSDAEGRFLFSFVPPATHQVYLIQSTLPSRWQTDLPENPVKLLLNPGMEASSRVTPWVVLQARYQDDAIAGTVFADLDQDGRMSTGDIGLAGVTVVDPGIHQLFVPFNDRNLWQLFSGANQCQASGYGDVSDTLESTLSLTSSEDNSQWFYDHWEDGYDADPLVPGPTTETGVLDTGETRVFQQTVDTLDLGNPGNLQYDGRDRITVVGHPGTVVRMVFPSVVEFNDPGVVLATAWEVPEVLHWGSQYVATVGEDLDFNGPWMDDFDFTGLEVMAAFPNTQVSYNGALVATLGPGETYLVNGANDGAGGGGVNSGDVISASGPIQVLTFVGGCDMSLGWSAQGFALVPVTDWGNEYWAPVPDFTDGIGGCDIDLNGAPNEDRDIDIYVHNPQGSAIDVTLNIPGSAAFDPTVVSVPANSTWSVMDLAGWTDLPPDSTNTQAVRLTSTANFWALSMVDSSTDGTNEPRINDWGYSLVPVDDLSSQVVIGWAPGNNAGPPPTNNGNLAFVTATANTTVFVDLEQDGAPDNFDMNGDGDAADTGVYGLFDETTSAGGVPLAAGQVLRVGDPVDRSLVGALIYTTDLSQRLAVAWGQDACATDRADPYLDLGYTPLAVEIPFLDKVEELAVDADSSGGISGGDTLTYTVTVENNGFGAMSNVVLTDNLPFSFVDFELGSIASTTPYGGEAYDDGSGTFTYTPIGAPGTTDAAINAFRLTWGTLAARSTITVTFRVAIQNDIPIGQSEICNFVTVSSEDTNPLEANTCRLVTQQEPTPTPTSTPTNTPTPTPTATPTTTGTPPTVTPTPTGTPPPILPPPPAPPAPPNEIPEPLTIVLLGGGLAALAGYARRRQGR